MCITQTWLSGESNKSFGLQMWSHVENIHFPLKDTIQYTQEWTDEKWRSGTRKQRWEICVEEPKKQKNL